MRGLLADRHRGLAPEGHAQFPQQCQGRVVATGGRDEGDIHPVDLLDLVVVDLRENHLLLEPDGVVAAPVEALGREPPEVPHARHRDADEAIQELVHPGAAQRHRAADRLPLPQVEVRDRLLGTRHNGPLAGDGGELRDRGLQPLGVLGRVAHPDVQDDLHELRNLVRVAEAELLGELRPDPLLVVVEQARPRGGLGGRRGRPRRLARSGTLSLGLLGLLLLARRPLTLRRRSGISRGSRSRRPGPGVGGALVLGLVLGLFRVRHRYLTRWIGWPDLTATRSMVPSLSRRRRTRVGWPDFGSSSITFDAAIGAGNSMIPLSPWGVVARLCFFTTFTPSTTTRNCLGYTCRTLPSRPRSSPRITRTRSPLATWSLWRAGSRSVRRARRLFLKTSGFISDHLRRERHDLHELLLAQLAPDRPEDAGRAGLALVGDEHRGVLVEPDVRAILALGLLGGPHDDGPHHLALLDLPGRDGVLDRDDDDVAQPTVAALGAAEHADHERAARARVVGNLDDRFLLDHDPSALLRALDDLDHPPPLQLRQRPRLHDADRVAQLRAPLVVGRDLLGAHDLFAVESVGEAAGL